MIQPPVEIPATDYDSLQMFLFLALAMLVPIAMSGLYELVFPKKPKRK